MYLEQFKNKSLNLNKSSMKKIIGGYGQVGWSVSCGSGGGISFPCSSNCGSLAYFGYGATAYCGSSNWYMSPIYY